MTNRKNSKIDAENNGNNEMQLLRLFTPDIIKFSMCYKTLEVVYSSVITFKSIYCHYDATFLMNNYRANEPKHFCFSWSKVFLIIIHIIFEIKELISNI